MAGWVWSLGGVAAAIGLGGTATPSRRWSDHGPRQEEPQAAGCTGIHTLVNTASEVLYRHERQLHAQLNRNVSVGTGSARIRVSLQIVPDEGNPHAVLTAHDELAAELGEVRVAPGFKFNGAGEHELLDLGIGRSEIPSLLRHNASVARRRT